jgi:hypothetical protein
MEKDFRKKGSATEEVRGGNGHGPHSQMFGPRGAYLLPPRCSNVIDLHLDGFVLI